MSTHPRISELQMIRDEPMYCPMTKLALVLLILMVLAGLYIACRAAPIVEFQ